MAKGERSSVDIEAANESDGSLCFSDAEDRSWHSQYNSNYNGSSFDEFRCSNATNHEIDGIDELCRTSCVSDCSFEGDLECGTPNSKLDLDKDEKDCRICHLSLENNAIVLGCSCKDDLAAAHKQCAETWFKIKGNKTCEICGSIAKNVITASEAEVIIEQTNETNSNAVVSGQQNENQSFWQGHRFLNFLLACMVFAFVISWLFHFNVPT